mgnify:CR=1 FL=1
MRGKVPTGGASSAIDSRKVADMGKVCVVTGGCGGMGFASAMELGRDYALVITGRNPEKLESKVAQLRDMGFEAHGCACNVGVREDVAKLAKTASELGEVMAVVHTAGVSPALCAAEGIMATNAVGTVNIVEEFFDVMGEGGVLINFASMAAFAMEPTAEWLEAYDLWREPEFQDKMLALCGEAIDDPDFAFMRNGTAYSISKRFVVEFSRRNSARFAAKGCRILSVSPGCYYTDMHKALIERQADTAEAQLDLIPVGRWGHPYEIGGLVKFLCSSDAAYITGTDILADGGSTANMSVAQV